MEVTSNVSQLQFYPYGLLIPMRSITGIPVLLRSCEFTNHLPGWKIQVYFYLGYVLDERMEINVIVIKIKHPFSEIPF